MAYQNNAMYLRTGEKRMVSKFANINYAPERQWYGIIEKENGKSIVVEYSSKFRHVAMGNFEDVAATFGGQVKFVRAVQ